MPRLLFVSGASLVGQNVLATLAARRRNLRLAALNSEAREPALYDFDEAWLVPEEKADPEGFRDRFLEVYGQYMPNLVIPCRDDDILFLARMREEMPAMSRSFLCGNVETAKAMLDKLHSWQFATAHDLPFAATIAMDAPFDQLKAFAEGHGYPLLAKPREGFASRGVSLILDPAQLAAARRHKTHLLQEYLGDPAPVLDYAQRIREEGLPLFHTLEGLKHSIQVFISPEGVVGDAFVTGNKMVFGKSERVSLEHAPDIQALGLRCGQAFAEAGWRGPLNIQCERTPDGRVVIYEFNGRFTGATAARYLLGHDEVGIALKAFANIALDPPKPIAGATEVIRLPHGRVIHPGNTAQLQREGVWNATD